IADADLAERVVGADEGQHVLLRIEVQHAVQTDGLRLGVQVVIVLAERYRLPPGQGELESITALAAHVVVPTGKTGTVTAVEQIVAGTAVEPVTALAPVQAVVAVAPEQAIVAIVAVQVVA